MARRHTLTSPEERNLPRSGAFRTAIRVAYVDRILDDKTGELMYGEIKDEITGELIQRRASRKLRRQIAHQSRLHNDGKPWQLSRDVIENHPKVHVVHRPKPKKVAVAA